MIRVVFMGTPDFAVPSLQRLIENQLVIGVVTQPDRPAGRGRDVTPPPVKVAARAASIPVYQPPTLRLPDAAQLLRQWAPDIIVVAAFGQILRPHILNLPPSGCLNIHASLLPRWRGAAPIQHAILAGDKESGISLMKMDEGLDTGPVYIQEALLIDPLDTAATLHDRLAILGAELLDRHLDGIYDGTLSPIPQDDDKATYARLLKKEDGLIAWDRRADEVDRQIRAMTPWPGSFTNWQGARLKILAARPVLDRRSSDGVPGQVVAHSDGVVILTGAGGIRLERVQISGKRAMSVGEFVRGRPDFIGAVLGR